MTSKNCAPKETLTLDRLFGIVRSGPRRRILEAIREESPRGMAEMTEVARRHHRDAESARTALYHNHLPRLDEAGLVRWNPDGETVARGARFGEVQPFLELMHENRDALPGDWP